MHSFCLVDVRMECKTKKGFVMQRIVDLDGMECNTICL